MTNRSTSEARSTSASFVTAFATGWPEAQPDIMVLSLTTHNGVQDFAFNKEIQTMFADLVIAIKERQGMLPDELDSTKRKFSGQRLLVDGFQKTRTKRSVHSDRVSNNFFRNF